MIALAHAHLSLLFGSALMLIGILSSLAASRFGVPILLVFLGIGMVAGEDGPGGIPFNDYGLTYLVGSAALAIILFDGGLRTRTATVRSVLAPAGVLASLGVVITTVLTGLVAMQLLKLPLVPSLLIGAIVASTDAAVVFFLLRTGGLQLRRKVGATLEVESGTNDPFAVILTVVLVQIALGTTEGPWWHVALSIVDTIAIGLTLGLVGGVGLVAVLNRLTLPTGLHPAFVVTAAIVTFAAAQSLEGSGFMAAYVAGLVVGNRPIRAYGSIITFHDTATWLCQIILFTLLGLLVTPSKVVPILLPGIAIALFLITIGRPVAVFACLAPFRFSRREMTFISWVGLRGGVSIFLATIPTLARLPQAEIYFNVAFVVVVVSLVLQGWTIGAVARKTGVALRDSAPDVQRIDIDLPGQLDAELVGYPLVDPSPATRHRALPSWVRPVLVIRAGAILGPVEAGPFKAGDYGYFLAPTQRLARLDRFFAVDGARPDQAPLPEFPFDAGLPAGAVADLYGITIDADERPQTIAELFAERLDGAPHEGDRIDFGVAVLVAHGVRDDKVKLAGLLLEATPEEEDAAPVPTWRRVLSRLANRLSTLARRPAG
jgi:potassium/hydrogen antiporter